MNKLQEVGIIVGGGALGGVASVMGAWSTIDTLSIAKFLALFVEPFFKGGLAAGIGVYVLTTIDSAQMAKAFFFAVTCGLAFPSILEEGGSLARSTVAQVANLTVDEEAEKISAIASGEMPSGKVNVADIKHATTRILAAQAKSGEDGRVKAELALEQAVSVLSKKAAAGDENAVKAISELGTQTMTRNVNISNIAFHELTMLKGSADNTVKHSATTEIKRLEQPFFAIRPIERRQQ